MSTFPYVDGYSDEGRARDPDLELSFLATGLDSVGLVVGVEEEEEEELLVLGLGWRSKLGRETGRGFS